MTSVPELSLADYVRGPDPERERFTTALFEGFREFGFVILRDHGIAPGDLAQAYRASADFFSRTEAFKTKFRGYAPLGREQALTARHPDLKEFFHVGRDVAANHPLKRFYKDNVWPEDVPNFRAVFTTLYRALDDVGRQMLGALAGPLRVDPDYFDRLTDLGASTLRLLHYPPVPADANPKCVRAAAHEDINLITLLPSASASGLELLTRAGEWLPVETAPDNLIVDAGDMLARITNDVIPATTHRVVNPRGPNVSRYSMPFFMHPNPDAVLTCIPSCRGAGARYPDITEHALRAERLAAIGIKPTADASAP